MDATDQARQLFEKFEQLHRNTNEVFNPTLANIQRWHWSVEQAQNRNSKKFDKFDVPDQTSALALAKSRRFRVFSKMPDYMQRRFAEIAAKFPGRKVWATGSRVNGEYIDEFSGIRIVRMREALLKKEIQESDYDVVVELREGDNLNEIRAKLPKGADLVVNPDPTQPKILIPMWDFSKLPKEKHGKVIELVGLRRWGELMAIHNEYQLSVNFYCCEANAVRDWFTWAIENNLITNEDPQTSIDEVVD